MKDKVCATCRFWQKPLPRTFEGACHIRSEMPVPAPSGDGYYVWPPRMTDDWCAEWKAEAIK